MPAETPLNSVASIHVVTHCWIHVDSLGLILVETPLVMVPERRVLLKILEKTSALAEVAPLDVRTPAAILFNLPRDAPRRRVVLIHAATHTLTLVASLTLTLVATLLWKMERPVPPPVWLKMMSMSALMPVAIPFKTHVAILLINAAWILVAIRSWILVASPSWTRVEILP